MTIRAVLSCNGREGVYPCRQATPVGEVLTASEARRIAKKIHGWSSEVVPGPGAPFLVHDYCQSCTKKRAEGKL